MGSPRRRGAEIAKTSWLLFSDADVIFASDYFNIVAGLKEEAAYYGPKLSRDRFLLYYSWMPAGEVLCHNRRIPSASGSNLLVSREALSAVGGFDLGLSCNEDSELVWRIARAGFGTRFVKDLVVYATDHLRIKASHTRKTLHSLVRCELLLTDLMPRKMRSLDWGYWQNRNQ